MLNRSRMLINATLVLALLQLQACAGIHSGDDVTAAYDSGVIATAPYSRSIFTIANY